MKRLTLFIFACLSLSAFAANPSFQSFNVNQFDVTGNRVAIKVGATITNLTLVGTLTNLLEVYNENDELKFYIDTNGFIWPSASQNFTADTVTITNDLTVRGNIKGGTLVITNDVRFYNNTYISNIYAFTGFLSNNLTVLGTSAFNTFTANSGTISNANGLTIGGNIAATYAGITNVMTWALSDMTTALTTGTNKNYWYAPAAGMTIKFVRATLATTSSGAAPVFDINEAGTSILSTKITVDAGEWDSLDATTQPVISDSAIAGKAKIDFDIDTAGTAAAGAQIQIGFTVP